MKGYRDNIALQDWFKLLRHFKKKLKEVDHRNGRIYLGRKKLYEYMIKLQKEYIKEELRKPKQLKIEL